MSALSSLGNEPWVFTRRRNSPLSLDDVGRADRLPLLLREAVHRQQLVTGFLEAAHDARAARLPLAGEGAVRLARRALAGRVDDAVEVVGDLLARVLRRLAHQVAQLVHAAALHRRLAPDERERAPQASVAVDDAEQRHLEPALDQVLEEALPRLVRFAAAHLQRHQLLLPV